mmetsp:Transcript_18528/g.51619  ORF Transcript_18528/g.51619 Transcript_18528/m.51619 type:complete len:81 (-) Transcript_18528:935-1177(-)
MPLGREPGGCPSFDDAVSTSSSLRHAAPVSRRRLRDAAAVAPPSQQALRDAASAVLAHRERGLSCDDDAAAAARQLGRQV